MGKSNASSGEGARASDTLKKLPALLPGTNPLTATLTVAHAVSEGGVESLANLWNNAVGLLPAAVRRTFLKEPYLDQDLRGKVAIVTGGNAGIGFATAQQLARRGAHVVIACRDPERARAAVQAIAATPPLFPPASASSASASSAPSAFSPSAPAARPLSVESLPLDLSRLASVRAFAQEWRRRGTPLHLLVCNAGVMAPLTKTLTPDGMEMQFQVNFLSHWLLANLLLEQEHTRRGKAAGDGKGKEAAKGSSSSSGNGSGSGSSITGDGTRVVVVSSVVHRAGPLQWGDLLSERSYEPYVTYGLSKLASVMLAKELQRRFDRHPEAGCHDSAVAIHPGMVRTHLANNFFRSYGGAALSLAPLRALWSGFMDTVGQALLATPEAAYGMLHACLGPTERLGGRYLSMGMVYGAAQASDDPSKAAELWAAASRLTGHTPAASLS